MDEQRTVPAAVIVGVDGSGIALSAVRWATREARRRGAPLRIVHAAPYAERNADGQRRAASILTQAHTAASGVDREVPVTTELLTAQATPALTAAAADAELVVVGMGGGERYEDVRLHSTALALCTAAACPVAVVRGVGDAVPETGEVVLGIEDATADAAAVTVAFADAQRHHSDLVVVHAPHGTGPVRDHLMGQHAHTRKWDAAWFALTDGLAPWRSRHPDVPVEIRIVDAPAHAHLLQAAVTARVLVLGTHADRSATTRVVLGSTSHTVLRHAPCPVMVVRRDAVLSETVTAAGGRTAPAHPAPQQWALHVPDPRQRHETPGR
jgi:nucleotide-binding universal stress UspA family protein